jgi:hypothetical protein
MKFRSRQGLQVKGADPAKQRDCVDRARLKKLLPAQIGAAVGFPFGVTLLAEKVAFLIRHNHQFWECRSGERDSAASLSQYAFALKVKFTSLVSLPVIVTSAD